MQGGVTIGYMATRLQYVKFNRHRQFLLTELTLNIYHIRR